MMKKLFVLLWLIISSLCIVPTLSRAQSVSFEATVDRSKVGLGENFQVTYTISGGNPNGVRGFRAPDLNKDFLTLGGPNQSTSLQIVNGNYSSTVSFSFILQPRKMGKFVIPPAIVTVDGQQHTSNSVTIEVTIGSPKAAPQQNTQMEPKDVALNNDLFLRASIDKSEAFVAEPVIVTYKVYTRVSVQNFTLKKQPRTIGFWSEEFPTANQLDGTIETVNGKQYKAYVIRKVALFPTQSGQLEIDPIEINCIARVKQKRRTSGDSFFDRFFDDPFFDSYQAVEKELKAQTMKIHVKQLPIAGQPASFNGAVGEFEMKTSIDKSNVKTNETATIKVRIEGKGNIKLLEQPMIKFPADVDHFDPKTDESIVKNGGIVSGVKTFEYLMIPRYAGERTIEPIEFSFFDLNTKKYVTLKSDQFTLRIDQGKAESPMAANVDQQFVNYLNQDIRMVKDIQGGLRRSGEPLIPLSTILLLYLFPVAGAAGLILYRRKYNRDHRDVVGFKMKKANKVSEKRLARSKQYLDSNQIDSYYLEIARALWGYVQDRFAIPTAEVSHQIIGERLRLKNIPGEIIDDLKQAIDLTEYGRYSPTRATEPEMKTLYEKTKSVIVSIEQRLKG